jgi:hypothetical protein
MMDQLAERLVTRCIAGSLAGPPCIPGETYAILLSYCGGCMKEVRKVHYVKGVFVCPKCRQSYVQEKWIESWRVRCHRCDYRGALTDVSVEERMEEETFRR